ncbi:carboxypeptidase-like regulatory domain-containing protein [Hymenobacter siberiensis]|uniref:carboxypeptidase-like regulatory domain-containing protein n=1 Tax=Hymenobacter siberiensis TaxID=2848396 RepID=UPI001C1E5D48|nr:carboxypeptidase-like regulatory domain-containing protein [Hymenobacter siberiensis]MBU6121012.1 carboxypeptidase-like regulatory domain-containing protein [Hymenobacter siberiensis]
MRFSPVLLLLLLLLMRPDGARAQDSLSGVALDSVTQQPLAFASVFLANTTLGVTTTEQGQFSFPRVPAGNYDVVGSYVGYRLAKRKITMGASPQQLTLQLAPIPNQLGEVVVRAKPRRNPDRAANYQKFVTLFLGQTTFSRQCRIRNPDEVLVDFDADKNVLTASSPTYVQVDNQALGYRIKYYGLQFDYYFSKNLVKFYGQPAFEEMSPRNEQEQLQWEQNRAKAYRGSLTHFLKSVHDNQVSAEGFLVQRLRMVLNSRYARADSLRWSLFRARRNTGLSRADNDSLARWGKEAEIYSTLYTAARPIDSLRRVSAPAAQVFLRFTDYLQVTYSRESPDPHYLRSAVSNVRIAMNPPTEQVSQLKLLEPEVEIQPNGQLTNPMAVFTDEYWGFEKMGEFLPVNYLPPASAAPIPTHP